MGGSAVLNPRSRRYNELQNAVSAHFTDTYFPADAAIMYTNSRELTARVERANGNAEEVFGLLKRHASVAKGF